MGHVKLEEAYFVYVSLCVMVCVSVASVMSTSQLTSVARRWQGKPNMPDYPVFFP